MSESVPVTRCGPCCSVAPTGSTATRPAAAASPTSSSVSSAHRNSVQPLPQLLVRDAAFERNPRVHVLGPDDVSDRAHRDLVIELLAADELAHDEVSERDADADAVDVERAVAPAVANGVDGLRSAVARDHLHLPEQSALAERLDAAVRGLVVVRH